jgi:hypothetical protein
VSAHIRHPLRIAAVALGSIGAHGTVPWGRR